MLATPGVLIISQGELRFKVNVEKLRQMREKQNNENGNGANNGSGRKPSRKRGLDKHKLLRHARSKVWKVASITEMEFRRYQLQPIALEFFFVDAGRALFVNFNSSKLRNHVYETIRMHCRPPRVREFYSTSSSARARRRKSRLVEAWQTREITNFDFLMRLNFLAGRTYNDLSQYPIFPWVLSDYTSQTLDLRDPRVYRNFERPIAVQKDSRMLYFQKRYKQSKHLYEQMRATNANNDGDDDGLSSLFYPVPRHYSTHYSNPQIVLWYMIRLDPFTAAHIHLQDGVFDIADRQFHSIADAWRGSNSNDHDVKELIPEFFYLPDFLRNMNNLDLGIKVG